MCCAKTVLNAFTTRARREADREVHACVERIRHVDDCLARKRITRVPDDVVDRAEGDREEHDIAPGHRLANRRLVLADRAHVVPSAFQSASERAPDAAVAENSDLRCHDSSPLATSGLLAETEFVVINS